MEEGKMCEMCNANPAMEGETHCADCKAKMAEGGDMPAEGGDAM